jgi:hypothetical protein
MLNPLFLIKKRVFDLFVALPQINLAAQQKLFYNGASQ